MLTDKTTVTASATPDKLRSERGEGNAPCKKLETRLSIYKEAYEKTLAQRDALLAALKDATAWFIEGERKAGLPDPHWVISGVDAIAHAEGGK